MKRQIYFFVFSLSAFQHPLRKRESSFLEVSLLWQTSVSHKLTAPHHQEVPSSRSTHRENRAPCQTKCCAQCMMPALALFTQILIDPPGWEWTSKNGFSWPLWIAFYSRGFPTVLVSDKAWGTCSGEKMWGISCWILDSPASLREWEAIFSLQWLPAWDGLVRLALNFRNSDKVSGRSLWKAQVGFTILPFASHNSFNNLCLGKAQHFRVN